MTFTWDEANGFSKKSKMICSSSMRDDEEEGRDDRSSGDKDVIIESEDNQIIEDAK